VESLNMLLNIYILSQDEKEILHISGKLYSRCNEYEKERLTEIGDKVHQIILKYRETFRNVYNDIEDATYQGNFMHVRFLKSYLDSFSDEVLDNLFKLIKDTKKAYISMIDANYVEGIIFLNIK
jgi:hypothetical protein